MRLRSRVIPCRDWTITFRLASLRELGGLFRVCLPRPLREQLPGPLTASLHHVLLRGLPRELLHRVPLRSLRAPGLFHARLLLKWMPERR